MQTYRSDSELDWDGDVCECGVPIAEHPEIPKKPLGSWKSRRSIGAAASENARMSGGWIVKTIFAKPKQS